MTAYLTPLPAAVQFVFYLLWGNIMIAASFFLSCFFASPRVAAAFCYFWVFASGEERSAVVGKRAMKCVKLDSAPASESSRRCTSA